MALVVAGAVLFAFGVVRSSTALLSLSLAATALAAAALLVGVRQFRVAPARGEGGRAEADGPDLPSGPEPRGTEHARPPGPDV